MKEASTGYIEVYLRTITRQVPPISMWTLLTRLQDLFEAFIPFWDALGSRMWMLIKYYFIRSKPSDF